LNRGDVRRALTAPGGSIVVSLTAPSLEIVPDQDLQPRIDFGRLREGVSRLQETCGVRVSRLAVAIVGDARMMALHQRHCGMASTTDVLTFPQSAADEPIDADIAICADEAARRAAEFGHPIEQELLLYIVHGLLHCLGFDDHDQAAYQRMHAEEDRMLQAIGIGATFHAARTGSPPGSPPDSRGSS
jgi:probable rRNA maturation factor